MGGRQFVSTHRDGLLLADTSYTPAPESRDCLKPVSCYRIRANFSNTNKRFRPGAVHPCGWKQTVYRPNLPGVTSHLMASSCADELPTRSKTRRITNRFSTTSPGDETKTCNSFFLLESIDKNDDGEVARVFAGVATNAHGTVIIIGRSAPVAVTVFYTG